MHVVALFLEAKKQQQSVINTFERELTDTSKKTLKTIRLATHTNNMSYFKTPASSKVTNKSTSKKRGKQFKSKKR